MSSHAFSRHYFLLGLSLGLFSVVAASQSIPLANFSPGSSADAAAITISKRVDEVNLAFTVTDKKGRLVKNMCSRDFTILDNHIAPEGLSFFQQQTDLPLRLAVLIDASDSILYRFDYEKTAAAMFLKRILRPGKDQAFLVAFNDRVNLVQDNTDNSKQLMKAVKRVKGGGNTALYDAVIFAAGKLRQGPPQTRKAVIPISDGIETRSRSHLFDAEQAAIRTETTMFALSTNEFIYSIDAKGESVLKQLTDPTGGKILPARDEYHLNQAFRQVEEALRNQYAVGYRPALFAPDGSFRTVEVSPLVKG